MVDGILYRCYLFQHFVSGDLVMFHPVKCAARFSFGCILVSHLYTPWTTLTIAVIRYITVCHPVFSTTETFAKLQLYANIFISLLSFTLIMSHAAYLGYTFVPFNPYQFTKCEMLFYNSNTTRVLSQGLLFFIVPATICVALYTLVGKTLWRKTAMQKRKRQLTILFLCSCAVWIVFWTPEVVYWFTVKMTPLATKEKIVLLFERMSVHITRLSCIAQPVILIFCYRPLFEPLQKLFRRDIPK